MAKERDGSINIYGSLQAKTEDGVVVYTDGIVHENEDGTKTPLDQLLKDSGGIIDVDKLPQNGWSGTAVPNSGLIEKIYINKNLSNEEIIKILDSLELINLESMGYPGGTGYLPYADSNNISFLIYKNSDVYFINYVEGSNSTYFWDSNDGWKEEAVIEYTLNSNNIIESYATQLGQTMQNDKLSLLFSTTPFVYKEADINDKSIYRLKEPDKTHLEGTLLVSNQETTVNKVLFNDSLPNETTNQILGSLTYTNFNGLNINVLFTNSTATKVIFAYKWAVGKYGLYYSTNIASGKADVVFYDDGKGWVTNEIEINDVGVSSLYGLSIGTNNETLQQVLSMNDNFTEVAYSYKYNYWVFKDKWKQLIDGDNLPDYTTIIKTTCSTFTNGLFDDITLTEEQFYTAKNAKDCLLIVTVGNLIPFYFRKTTGYNTGGDIAYDVVCFVGNRMSISSEETYIYTAPTPVMLTFTNKKLTANQEKLDLFRSFKYASYGGLYIETGEGSASVEFDKTPTQNSNRLVSSGGVFNALQEKQNKITVIENDDGTVDITIPTE